jgi:hypothetical protein
VWALPQTVSAVRQALRRRFQIGLVDVPDPVQIGFVESLSHPGGSFDGHLNVSHELMRKRVHCCARHGLIRPASPCWANLAISASGTTILRRIKPGKGHSAPPGARTYAVQETSEFARRVRCHCAQGRHGDRGALARMPGSPETRGNHRACTLRHRIPAMYTTFGVSGAWRTVHLRETDLIDMSFRAAALRRQDSEGRKAGRYPRPATNRVRLPVINAGRRAKIGMIVPPWS